MAVAASMDGVLCKRAVSFHHTCISISQRMAFTRHFRQGPPRVLSSGKASVTGSGAAPLEAGVKKRRMEDGNGFAGLSPGTAEERSGCEELATIIRVY